MRRRPRLQFPLPPRMPCHRLPQRLLRPLSRNRIDARVILFHALPFSVLVFSMLPRCVLVSSNEPRERNSRAELRTPRVRWLVRGNYRGAEIGGMASGVMTVGVGTPASENEFKITRSTRRFVARPSAVSFDAVG